MNVQLKWLAVVTGENSAVILSLRGCQENVLICNEYKNLTMLPSALAEHMSFVHFLLIWLHFQQTIAIM